MRRHLSLILVALVAAIAAVPAQQPDPIAYRLSFDERAHTYLGYALKVRGSIGGQVREFLVGVGEGAHAKHQFRMGDMVSGEALPVADPHL